MKSFPLFAVLSLLLCADASPQAWFKAPRVVNEGGTILAVGDLDGDGDADLVTLLGSQLVPLLNDGAAGFAASSAQAVLAGSSTTNEPARLADIDGDGRLDLVMVGGNAMHVYSGQAGGSFAAGQAVPLPFAVVGYDFGDMNQDGRMDIAVVSFQGMRVGWIFHNGTSLQTTSFPTAPDFMYDVAAIDYDNDGDADLVASLSSFNQVLLAPTVAGQPSIGGTVVAGSASKSNGGLLSGDLDGDGDADLVVVYNDSSDVEIATLENQSGALVPGSVTTLVNAGFEVNSEGMVAADWDGDGDLDLATQTLLSLFGQSRNRAFLIENTTGLAFAGLYESPVSTLGWLGGVADFDGDGRLDVASAGAIMPGDGTFEGFRFAPNFSSDPGAELLDIEGDGDLDLRHFGFASINDATGKLTSKNLFPSPGVGLEYRGGVHADFDGDGITDAVAAKWQPSGSPFIDDTFIEMSFLKGDGTGAYVDVGAAASAGVELAAPVAGDYDKDGDVDLLTQSTLGGLPAAIWRNNGSGFFPFTLPAPAGIVEDQIDVDGDGDVDLLARSGTTLVIHRTQGGGAFQSSVVLSQANLSAGARFRDVDQDGDPDVVAHSNLTSSSGDKLWIVENVGGSFVAPVSLLLSGMEPEVYGVGDADGDGVSDLFAASTLDDAATWSENNAYGRVHVWRRIGPGLQYAPAKVFIGHRNSGFADMDGDGDVDILGATLVESRRLDGPAAGLIRQFGVGTAGAGGAVPVIGAQGPAQVGSTSYQLRLVRGVGGGALVLALGTSVIDVNNAPVLGAHFYVGNLLLVLPITLPGPVGAAGQGSFTFPAPITPSLLGLRVVHQTLHGDPAAQWGVATSNGLEVVFGG